MPNDRFFSSEDLKQDHSICIKDQELHHMQHVMRVKENELIEVINGKGQLATGRVKKFHKHTAEVVIDQVINKPRPEYELILAQGIPRLSRLETIIEKATELGATEIWLFPSLQTEKKEITPSQSQRMHQILISSIKQCGRLYLPEIKIKPPLSAWNPLNIPCLFGDTQHAPPSILSLLIEKKINTILWLVGPEKGLTQQETDILTHKLHFQGATLNNNILRTDTAAIAGLSIISSLINYNNI